ncbi:MAG: hypothetical protein JO063_04215 [Pseudonocardiales bacterium]|nr:hypothetical protein [Pseudonocardiales bacterium]MBW0009317.1 hypothetical protein [Pseudonocardiales bacterium]
MAFTWAPAGADAGLYVSALVVVAEAVAAFDVGFGAASVPSPWRVAAVTAAMVSPLYAHAVGMTATTAVTTASVSRRRIDPRPVTGCLHSPLFEHFG